MAEMNSTQFLKAFDYVSDAILVYSHNGLVKHNVAAKNLFGNDFELLNKNTPFFYDSNKVVPSHHCDLPDKQLSVIATSRYDNEKRMTLLLPYSTIEASIILQHFSINDIDYYLFIIKSTTIHSKQDNPTPCYLTAIIDTLPLEVWAIDKNFTTILQNKHCINKQGDIVGQPLKKCAANYKSALEGKTHESEQTININGEERVIHEILSPLKNSNNEIEGVVGVNIDLTHLREIEKSLRESEVRYRIVAHLSGSIVYDLDLVQNKLSWQGSVYDLTGYTIEEYECFGYEKILSFIHPDDRARVIEDFETALKTGSSFKSEFLYVRKDNEWIVVEDMAYIIYDDNHQPYRVIGCKKDITARKKSENKLIDNELWYRQLYEMANDAIFIVEDRITIDCNSKTFELFNCEKSDLVGFSPLVYSCEFQPDGQYSIDKINSLLPLIEPEKPFFFEWQFMKKSGERWDAEVSVSQIQFASRTLLIGVVRDISERKNFNKKLLASEKKYRTLFETMFHGFLVIKPVWDKNGQYKDAVYMDVNPAYLSIVNKEAHEVVGRKLSEVTKINPEWIPRFEHVYKTGERAVFEDYHRHLKRYVNFMIYRTFNHNLAIVFEDITDLKTSQQQIVDTIVQVEERERRKLAGDLHDEIGPQLASLRIYLASLAKNGLNNNQLSIYKTITDLLENTTSSVREISANLSPSMLAKYGLTSAINAECDYIRMLLYVDFHHNLKKIRLDEKIEIMIYRIVKELLNNSKKYAEATMVTIDLIYINEQLTLIYTDNGNGFDYEKIKQSGKATLGLSNIEMRVKSLNGRSVFRSGIGGRGVCFELVAPIPSGSIIAIDENYVTHNNINKTSLLW
jgi:PAS domain S-box-containing protein